MRRARRLPRPGRIVDAASGALLLDLGDGLRLHRPRDAVRSVPLRHATRHLGRTDHDALAIIAETIRLVERRAAFSRRRCPELLTRASPDTIALFCVHGGQNRSDRARRPSCDDLFADPVIAAPTPPPRPAHPYATREIDVDTPHRVPDVSSLHAHVRERYRDETGCLHVQIVPGPRRSAVEPLTGASAPGAAIGYHRARRWRVARAEDPGESERKPE